MTAGVYLHIPFCKSRCSYCDFATDIYRSGDAAERYVAALCKEVMAFEKSGGDTSLSECINLDETNTIPHGRVPTGVDDSRVVVDTIYFGGGTPSLLNAVQVEKILAAVRSRFSVDSSAEITMEMNPATVTMESLRDYKSLGVNRASFGVQTFNDQALKLLARGHDANDARRTYEMLRDAAFENISFDLIAGLPGQTLQDWERNLDEAIKMSPEHLSLYLLEIHEGTPLAEQVRSGRQPRPDDNLAAQMYEMMCERLADAGYHQYEISNFAKPERESRHNSKYWRLDPVFGFGVSAHSFDGRDRYANECDTNCYVEMIESTGVAEVSRQNIELVSEFTFLGLRMNSGIMLDDFSQQFGVSILDKYTVEIDELVDLGLIELTDSNLHLTRAGRLYSNEVFQRFV
jgi:oxygen-independent coproporphyrinogen III oxidase